MRAQEGIPQHWLIESLFPLRYIPPLCSDRTISWPRPHLDGLWIEHVADGDAVYVLVLG